MSAEGARAVFSVPLERLNSADSDNIQEESLQDNIQEKSLQHNIQELQHNNGNEELLATKHLRRYVSKQVTAEGRLINDFFSSTLRSTTGWIPLMAYQRRSRIRRMSEKGRRRVTLRMGCAGEGELPKKYLRRCH